MIWIERIAIDVAAFEIAVQLFEFFPALVTVRAQRLQLTEPEFVDVAVVRLDVISDTSRNRTTTFG